jgi:hypothetical protein
MDYRNLVICFFALSAVTVTLLLPHLRTRHRIGLIAALLCMVPVILRLVAN